MLGLPFVTLPQKRKAPEYYQRIREPIDLTTIEQNINSGLYSTVEAFDCDVCRLLSNSLRFYGRTSETGIAAVRLRRAYQAAKAAVLPALTALSDVLGENVPASFINEKDPGKFGCLPANS